MNRFGALGPGEFDEILRLVRPGSRVLDVGCGDGVLLERLQREKGVDGRGLEIDPDAVVTCLAKGLEVIKGDAEQDLSSFAAASFDYAILSQTLRAARAPRLMLQELLGLADRVIVSFPNFAHWRVRRSFLFEGRMPRTRALPEAWWDSRNIHLCTIRDFTDLCAELGLRIEAASALVHDRPARPMDPLNPIENWRAEGALFLLGRRASIHAMADTDMADTDPMDLFGPKGSR